MKRRPRGKKRKSMVILVRSKPVSQKQHDEVKRGGPGGKKEEGREGGRRATAESFIGEWGEGSGKEEGSRKGSPSVCRAAALGKKLL